MSYLIMAREQPRWSWSEKQITKALKPIFQVSRISPNPIPMYACEWVVELRNGPLSVSLFDDKQVVALEGHYLDCLSFAVWFKHALADDKKVALCSEDAADIVDLELTTTVRDMCDALGC